MGFDFEGMLGKDGQNLADAYEDAVYDAFEKEEKPNNPVKFKADTDIAAAQRKSTGAIFWEGHSVKIRDEWSNHKFSDEELCTLEKGESIRFTYEKNGKTHIVIGKLGEINFTPEYYENEKSFYLLNQNANIPKVWNGHEFTQEEISSFINGEEISYEGLYKDAKKKFNSKITDVVLENRFVTKFESQEEYKVRIRISYDIGDVKESFEMLLTEADISNMRRQYTEDKENHYRENPDALYNEEGLPVFRGCECDEYLYSNILEEAKKDAEKKHINGNLNDIQIIYPVEQWDEN